MFTEWTDCLVERLLSLWREGRTARQVGKTLGLTRNAVIGKLHRLGERSPYADNPNAASIYGKRGAAARRKNLQIMGAAPKKPYRARPQPKPNPFIGMPPARGIGAEEALRKLRATDCRWPIGDPRHDNFRFCGAPRDPHSYYCEHHYVASINPDYKYGERQWPDTKRIWRR